MMASFSTSLSYQSLSWTHRWQAFLPVFHTSHCHGHTDGKLFYQSFIPVIVMDTQMASFSTSLSYQSLSWTHRWQAFLPVFHTSHCCGHTDGKLFYQSFIPVIVMDTQMASFSTSLSYQSLSWTHRWQAFLPVFHTSHCCGHTDGKLFYQSFIPVIVVDTQMASFLPVFHTSHCCGHTDGKLFYQSFIPVIVVDTQMASFSTSLSYQSWLWTHRWQAFQPVFHTSHGHRHP